MKILCSRLPTLIVSDKQRYYRIVIVNERENSEDLAVAAIAERQAKVYLRCYNERNKPPGFHAEMRPIKLPSFLGDSHRKR